MTVDHFCRMSAKLFLPREQQTAVLIKCTIEWYNAVVEWEFSYMVLSIKNLRFEKLALLFNFSL